MWKSTLYEIHDSSQVGEVRRAAVICAMDLGFDEVQCGKLAIIMTELSTNILKHAHEGEIIITTTATSVEILAIDQGPGLNNVMESFTDGFSTTGTAGNGLGAVKRLASCFDVYSSPGKGSVFHVSFRKEKFDPALRFVGGVSIAFKGETLCGDSWTYRPQESGIKIMVADGLGHGLEAFEASFLAVETFQRQGKISTEENINGLHSLLRSTRGAAVSIADIDFEKAVVHFCGVGNVLGSIVSPGSVKRLITHNGTAGVQLRKVQAMTYPWDKDAILVIHSDGLRSHFNLKDYPGLLLRHPQLIAGVLFRDYKRVSDDSTVVVVRNRE
ncbi:MAG TPA: ATP-binding SpoIIE family protein phosphatase [Bacteriovoracaceae bacterium]|nr:ATP-binding SpoIIE family protein phosphatase [Bacteriovoracaceae bacterium]